MNSSRLFAPSASGSASSICGSFKFSPCLANHASYDRDESASSCGTPGIAASELFSPLATVASPEVPCPAARFSGPVEVALSATPGSVSVISRFFFPHPRASTTTATTDTACAKKCLMARSVLRSRGGSTFGPHKSPRSRSVRQRHQHPQDQVDDDSGKGRAENRADNEENANERR